MNFDDAFSRFGTMSQLDRQTDGQSSFDSIVTMLSKDDCPSVYAIVYAVHSVV